MSGAEPPEVSLKEERQELVRQRLLRAGRAALRDIGARITVEEVASVANIGRRTVFRYFPTRDELMKAIIESAIDEYIRELPPPAEADLDGWLAALCLRIHKLNSSLGPGYWEFLVSPHEPGPVADVFSSRLEQRRAITQRLAEEAWRLSGKSGRPPSSLVATFALALGPLATATLLTDVGLDLEQSAQLTTQLLKAAIESSPERPRRARAQTRSVKSRTGNS